MEKLGNWSIKNNVTVNLIMVFIILAGIFTVMNMRREMFPQFSLDMIVVSVTYPGSSPEEVEEGIVLRIEDAIQDIVGVDEIRLLWAQIRRRLLHLNGRPLHKFAGFREALIEGAQGIQIGDAAT